MTVPEAPLEVMIGELRLTYGLDTVVIDGPPGGGSPIELPADADAVRQHCRLDRLGRYRPLSGLRGLPGGWQVRCVTLTEADTVVETVYPLALEHLAAYGEGRLHVAGLEAVLARQSGRYEVAAQLDAAGRQLATAVLCGACVRAPVGAGRLAGLGQIPCPEACSMLVALCREATLWQANPPVAAGASPSVPLGAFDQPGNPFREAYLAARSRRS